MPPKTYFEELSYALRRRELLPRPLEEDGLLPVEWNGRILCRVTESGAVRYDPTLSLIHIWGRPRYIGSAARTTRKSRTSGQGRSSPPAQAISEGPSTPAL